MSLGRNRRIVAPGRETVAPAPELTAQLARQLSSVSRDLRSIPLGDHATWARTAREVSGVLSAWSVGTEGVPGRLAHAADLLAKSAQTYRRQGPMPDRARRALGGTALLVAAGGKLGRGPVGQAAMMHELITLTATLAKVSAEAQRRTQADRLRELAQERLTKVYARLQQGETARAATPGRTQTEALGQAQQPVVDLDQLDPELRKSVERARAGRVSPSGATRSPVPNPLQKAPDRRTSTEHEADRGVGRVCCTSR